LPSAWSHKPTRMDGMPVEITFVFRFIGPHSCSTQFAELPACRDLNGSDKSSCATCMLLALRLLQSRFLTNAILTAATMTIPKSKVKSLCTNSEVALVRASRKGEIEKLSHSQLKRFAVRARKHFDKWRDLGRRHARTRSRLDSGDLGANTKLKAQIFREALDSFQARSTELEAANVPAAKKSQRKTKRDRSAEHRTTRAAVRKGMTAVEDLLNAQVHKRQKRTVAAPVPSSPQRKPAPSKRRPEKTASEARRGVKTVSLTKRGTNVVPVSSQEQRDAITVQQSRAVRSGQLKRIRAHISSRGRRSQARRDAKS
jgi:hypothetical protein